MKIYLATFYSADLKRSAERFKDQAKLMNVYDDILIFNQDDLNEDFKEYISILLKKGKTRGYGHWVWQTYIHQLMLNKMKEGDIYHWCDVGCHFNKKGVSRLKEYIDIVSSNHNGFLVDAVLLKCDIIESEAVKFENNQVKKTVKKATKRPTVYKKQKKVKIARN